MQNVCHSRSATTTLDNANEMAEQRENFLSAFPEVQEVVDTLKKYLRAKRQERNQHNAAVGADQLRRHLLPLLQKMYNKDNSNAYIEELCAQLTEACPSDASNQAAQLSSAPAATGPSTSHDHVYLQEMALFPISDEGRQYITRIIDCSLYQTKPPESGTCDGQLSKASRVRTF